MKARYSFNNDVDYLDTLIKIEKVRLRQHIAERIGPAPGNWTQTTSKKEG